MNGPKDTFVTAEVALYPLREPALTPALAQFARALEATDLVVTPGRMSTIVEGDAEQVLGGLSAAFREVAAAHSVVMRVVVSNACPSAGEVVSRNRQRGERPAP